MRFLNSSTTNNRLVYYRFGNSGGWAGWSGAQTVNKNGGTLDVGGSGDQDRIEYTVYEVEQIFYSATGPPLSESSGSPTIIEVGGSGPVLGDNKLLLRLRNLNQLPKGYIIRSDEGVLEADFSWPPRIVPPQADLDTILQAAEEPGSVEVARVTVDSNGNVIESMVWVIPADDPAWEQTTGDPTTPKVIEDGPATPIPYVPPSPNSGGIQYPETWNTSDLAKDSTVRASAEAQRALDNEYYTDSLGLFAGIVNATTNAGNKVSEVGTNIAKIYQASTNVPTLGATTNAAVGNSAGGITHSNTMAGIAANMQTWGATNIGQNTGIAVVLDYRDDPVSLDPFENPYWVSLFTWVKRVILWAATFLYVGSVMKTFFDFWRSLWAITPKHIWDMVPVPGVSTAVNLGWVGFLTIAAGVLPAVLVLVASEVVPTLGSNPFALTGNTVADPHGGGWDSHAVIELGLYWLYCVLPVTEVITLAISAYVYELKVGAIYSGLAMLFSSKPL